MSDETEIDESAVPEEGASAQEADAMTSETLESPVVEDSTVFRVMNVESVVFELGDASPQVHLMENEAPYRHLSVPIALAEAQALWGALNRVTGRRPGTHELMTAMLRRMQADIIAVRVLKVENGVFYATLDLMTPSGREEFDCRTSDGFILALRQTVVAPILCAEEVLATFYL